MLTGRREQIAALVGLLALNLGLGWALHGYWRDYRGQIQWIYSPISPRSATASNAPPLASVSAQNFAEIVNRTIFSPERTNASPTENAKVPELPILYGTMNLGSGVFALMAPGDQPAGVSRQVFQGQEIGGYKLVSIGDSQVEVVWGDKKFTVNVWESTRRVPRIVEKAGPAVRPAETPAPVTQPQPVTTVGPSPTSAFSNEMAEEKKKFTPAGYNAPAGAPVDAPAGTVFAGKRKVVNRTPFGDQVFWVDVQPSTNSPEPEKRP